MKTLATLAVAATFALTGCTEKIQPTDPDNPDNPGGETVENIYAGTSWVAHLESTYLYENILEMNITYDLMLDFLDTVSGELFHDVTIDVPAYPAASQHMNMTEPFTYTFADDSVVLNCKYFDEEVGDTVQYVYVLVYDQNANTLTMDADDLDMDPDMEELMGTNKIVFTRDETAKVLIPGVPESTGKINWRKAIALVTQAVKL